jgi:hypothetical protein
MFQDSPGVRVSSRGGSADKLRVNPIDFVLDQGQ